LFVDTHCTRDNFRLILFVAELVDRSRDFRYPRGSDYSWLRAYWDHKQFPCNVR